MKLSYVSGPKSYCTWLSVEIKHMDTSAAAAFGVPVVNIYSHNSIEVVHIFSISDAGGTQFLAS